MQTKRYCRMYVYGGLRDDCLDVAACLPQLPQNTTDMYERLTAQPPPNLCVHSVLRSFTGGKTKRHDTATLSSKRQNFGTPLSGRSLQPQSPLRIARGVPTPRRVSIPSPHCRLACLLPPSFAVVAGVPVYTAPLSSRSQSVRSRRLLTWNRSCVVSRFILISPPSDFTTRLVAISCVKSTSLSSRRPRLPKAVFKV